MGVLFYIEHTIVMMTAVYTHIHSPYSKFHMLFTGPADLNTDRGLAIFHIPGQIWEACSYEKGFMGL